MNISLNTERTAHAFLELLSLRGVDYFFANAGTDFATIVEAFAWRNEQLLEVALLIRVCWKMLTIGGGHPGDCRSGSVNSTPISSPIHQARHRSPSS